ncbi:hypothetical protein [Planococcus donghaensis]|uniref:hypothetical protein n=1 Tax=Planococcus donghaensis TaxID=414778 RepID=UPI0037354BDD
MTFLLLAIAFVGFVLIGIRGWKVQTHADMVFHQSMPFTLFYFMLMSYGLIVMLMPGEFDFLALILGVRGLMMCRDMNDSLLILMSLFSVTVILTSAFLSFVFPLVFGYLWYLKRK